MEKEEGHSKAVWTWLENDRLNKSVMEEMK